MVIILRFKTINIEPQNKMGGTHYIYWGLMMGYEIVERMLDEGGMLRLQWQVTFLKFARFA